MKYKLLALFLLITNFIYSQSNYKIEINGEVFEIELNKDYELNVKDDFFNIKVKQKDTLLYSDEALNFNFFKEFKISSTKVDEGIEQLVLMTAEGSGFIVQKYSTINPSTLNELMMNKVTKESVNYGFELKREDYERVLKSGLKINVDKAVLSYKDEINVYEITSFGKKDSGLLIMTMKMDNSEGSIGNELINLIWNTLEIK